MYEKLVADVKYLEGDYASAAEMYLEGARDGDALASFNYGYCLWRGRGVNYDPTAAKSYFAFARDVGDGEASYNLAMLYMHGEGVLRDYKRAYDYLCRSSDDGCIEATLYLGMLYTTGYMLEPEIIGISMIPYHKPEYLSELNFLTGDVPDLAADEDARASVARPDARRAFECFMRASRHDPTYVEELVAKGRFLYARCFIDGLGTDADWHKGARLMLRAADSGSADAAIYLAENGISRELLAPEKKSAHRLSTRR